MSIELPWRRRSIGARLSLLYTLVALTAVVLFAGITDWRLSTNFSAEHLRFMQAKVAELQMDLNDAEGKPQVLLGEIAKETEGTRLRQYEARVLIGGHVLGETPEMRRELPVTVFPPATDGLPAGPLQPHHADQYIYMLATVRLTRVNGDTPPELQLALDVTRDAALQNSLRRALALAFLLLVPLLAFAGRWVAAQGLAPLTRIAGAARAITPVDLSARLPLTPPWPDELHDLVLVFNAMLARIEEAFSRLSRFSVDLAHELRTPLANLSGELEVCLMRPRDAADYRTALESGLEECRRLNGLIENLLFMARAEHAEQALRCECFDIAQAFAWVTAQHAPSATARDIRIRLDGAATTVADPLLLRQALANLLGNAIRHSHDGGEVRITLQEVASGVDIRVQDDGEGIEAAHLTHLFDRFYQVDAARRRGVGQGTGLGLSIVKTIVELHGGTVRVESVRGRGTSVTMHVPSALQIQPGTSTGTPSPTSAHL
ncbi:MAG: heavy metal sensor histidine kinase [Xanthomonadaceae bacterium]|uniref:Sensor protein n=1 Tax=Rhodanobacter humi TaxID=1888173 RepID=A0ABV4AKR3_9GAMM|nr:heavy metal sensor histidine kinase [Xanthomonadaceae bacterium]MDE2318000.1 heavy metal sensor histidine kinase [Xanthomonadaceae bacterium]